MPIRVEGVPVVFMKDKDVWSTSAAEIPNSERGALNRPWETVVVSLLPNRTGGTQSVRVDAAKTTTKRKMAAKAQRGHTYSYSKKQT